MPVSLFKFKVTPEDEPEDEDPFEELVPVPPVETEELSEEPPSLLEEESSLDETVESIFEELWMGEEDPVKLQALKARLIKHRGISLNVFFMV